MSKFYEKILISLEKHTIMGVGGGLVDCKMWRGARDKYGYGVKTVTWPNGTKTLAKVHRLAYMAHHNVNVTAW